METCYVVARELKVDEAVQLPCRVFVGANARARALAYADEQRIVDGEYFFLVHKTDLDGGAEK